MKTTGIILAGGKSKRLGRNKAVEPLSGKSLVTHAFDRLQEVADEIIIVTSEELASLPYPEGSSVIVDVFPGRGPLSGIFTGLSAAKNQYCIAVGCDMPFLNEKLLRHMVERCAGFDAVVPKIGTAVEPLHSVYSRSCIPAIKAQLEAEINQIAALFNSVRVYYMGEQECREFDPDLESFINVNDQHDLKNAVKAAAKREGEPLC